MDHHIWITFIGNSDPQEFLLYDLQDSFLLVTSPLLKRRQLRSGHFRLDSICVDQVENVAISDNSTLAIIGAGIGAGIGTLAVTSNPSDDPTSKSLRPLIVLLVVGGGFAAGAEVGELIGPIKTKFHIHGLQQNYEKHRKKLRRKTIKRRGYIVKLEESPT